MKQPIEFVNNSGTAPDPIARSKEAGFQDLILKEAFRDKTCRFQQGITWLRFLPAVKGSTYDWIMPIDIYQAGDFASLTSPATMDRNNNDLFAVASRWIRANEPGLIANRETNPDGLRLWPKRTGVAWVIEEQAAEGERLRLFKGSLYDGARGGSTGLAYNIHLEATSRDNEPNSTTLGELVYGDVTAPTAGRLIKIEKLPASQSEFASYKIGIGKNPAPLENLMTLLTDEEHNMICPLEQVIHIPTEKEQRDALARYIGPDLVTKIFGKATTTVQSGWEPDRAVSSTDGDEPEPAASKPEPTPKAEPAPAKAAEPEPAPAPAAEPKAAAPAETPAATDAAPYTTREVTTLIGKEEEGIKELIANKGRIPKSLYPIVAENAQELGLSMD